MKTITLIDGEEIEIQTKSPTANNGNKNGINSTIRKLDYLRAIY